MIEFVTASRWRITDPARFCKTRIAGDKLYPYSVFSDNRQGLAACYNEFIRKRRESFTVAGDIVVFMHDDVVIEDATLAEKLTEAMRHFDIVGLAGSSDFTISEHSMWHHTPPWSRSGAVAHPNYGDLSRDPSNTIPESYDGVNQRGVASFGPMPKRCVVLDGLFLAVNFEKVFLEAGVTFDTMFDFHFYDLDFCLQAHDEGLRLGTWPISAIHQSPGLRSLDDPGFIANRDRFKDKWGPEGTRYACEQSR